MGSGTHTWVYLNDRGVLATTATWNTTDNPGQFSLMGTYGDVDGDGWLDLLVADNTQILQGSGLIRRYDGLAGGLFEATPSWSVYERYGSAVALADIDADGDLDLATGGWWAETRYFLNDRGSYPAGPDWSSAGISVVEAILFGDVDRDGLRLRQQRFDVSATPDRHLFELARQPIQQIEEVRVDGVAIPASAYTADPVHGWVSVGPAGSSSVSVRYVHSVSLDMAITNWDDELGNYLYYHAVSAAPNGDLDGEALVDTGDQEELASCYTGSSGCQRRRSGATRGSPRLHASPVQHRIDAPKGRALDPRADGQAEGAPISTNDRPISVSCPGDEDCAPREDIRARLVSNRGGALGSARAGRLRIRQSPARGGRAPRP